MSFGMQLIQIKTVKDLDRTIMDSLRKVVSSTVQDVHTRACEMAPVDTGRLRNNMIWSVDGVEYGGANMFPSTAPPSDTYEHKPKARPIGEAADMESPSALLKFPKNDDPEKVIGYMGNNVRRRDVGKAPWYGVHNEFGTCKMAPQPFVGPAAMQKGSSAVVTPKIVEELRDTKFGPTSEVIYERK